MRARNNVFVALGSALGFVLAATGMHGSLAGADTLPLLDLRAKLTPETAAQLAQGANRRVIVVMKNQLTGAESFADQSPVMEELAQVKAQRTKQFHMVNSFATMVSDGEVERLKVNPSVAQVVPDVVIRRKSKSSSTSAAAKSASSPSLSLKANVIPDACNANGRPMLDPEGLQTTQTDSDDPRINTARSLGITGAGVKVAYIADGIDPRNINFIRRNGRSAFFDYKDFTGDGLGEPTTGGEAFIDANAIAGQGLHVYNVNGYGAQSYPTPCNIRIEGVAPGASLLGMNVFGTYEYTTESNFLEAIEYAVTVDHVDIINESFGSNQFPDITALDVTKAFNEAAVNAGVTVTVSSGDAGYTNTIGSPASDPAVIAVGASTTFRVYAQTNYAAARYFASSGWLNDNISSLSSGGFNYTGTTIDLVAPGDIAFASCDASPLFSDCTNYPGVSSNIEESGGTSMSSPLTAGAAALVIEAYRKAHHGASPTPAMVKQILTSTATDLGTPATEQGAGLLNSYKAVLLAGTINDGAGWFGFPGWGGEPLTLSVNQLNNVGAPGSSASWPVTVTNSSPFGQFVQANGRTFGHSENVQKGSVTLTDGVNPEFANYAGLQNNYAVFNFNVPSGSDRLDASIAYPGTPANGGNSRVRLILIDPYGRFAAHSLPQGVGNFGNVDVRQPTGGTWTGVIFSDLASIKGTNGTIPWQVSTQRFAPFGEVSPSAFYLAPGQSRTVHVTAWTPSGPGDSAGAIVFCSSIGGFDAFVGPESTSIPVTLRSLVQVADGGMFKGVLTGGNGRDPGEGQEDYYQFYVGPGHRSITANVSLTNDVADAVGAYLVSPDGATVGFGQNSVNGTNTLALAAYTHDPAPGMWTLVLDFSSPVVGDEISQPFKGNIQLDTVRAHATGLPNSASQTLAAGTPVTIPVTIKNTGIAPEQYFVDARLNSITNVSLPVLYPPATGAGFTLPLGSDPSNANEPEWLVPSQTSKVQVAASATLPIVFDYGVAQGDPDLLGAPTTANHAAGSYAPSNGVVQPGYWFAVPSEIGPYAGPAPTGYTNVSLIAKMKAFDPAVTSDSSDLWLTSVQGFDALANFAPVTINPGSSAVINVTITPSGKPGTLVSGVLYVDDVEGGVPPYGQLSGDELVAIPYTYTIK